MKRVLNIIAINASLFVACHSATHEPHQTGTFLVTTPLKKDTELASEYVAQIHAIQHIEVRALERGYLQDTFVDEGQHVKVRHKMFQILPLIYQAKVDKAKAEADLANIEFKNTQMLLDKNIVSTSELALAKAKASKARAELSLEATHQRLTEIHAPFDGIVGRFNVRKGSLVGEGDLLTTLSDNSSVWVYFNVTEREYLAYKAKAAQDKNYPVKLVLANGEQFDQPGKVETIEADFNSETGNIAFRATFPNPKGLLRHGETGKILMTIPYRDAVLIPQKATFEILDRVYVYVVDDKGTVRSQPITVAAELPHLYIVKSGLKLTDKILVEGLRKVRDGKSVKTKYVQPADVIAKLNVPAE